MQSRLNKIKQLAREYFLLEKGALIERHVELLRIFDIDIRLVRCADHPHLGYRVYISRMALKHVVEERKFELEKHHDEQKVLNMIYFVIEKIPETIIDFDRHELEPKQNPPKYFYSKDFSHLDRPMIRILVEKKGMALEIRSIHFRKRDKTK